MIAVCAYQSVGSILKWGPHWREREREREEEEERVSNMIGMIEVISVPLTHALGPRSLVYMPEI